MGTLLRLVLFYREHLEYSFDQELRDQLAKDNHKNDGNYHKGNHNNRRPIKLLSQRKFLQVISQKDSNCEKANA